MVKVLGIIQSSKKMRILNNPYFIDKKNEALRSDLFKVNVNACPSLDSQRIHTGAHARIIYVCDSFSPQNINSPVLA